MERKKEIKVSIIAISILAALVSACVGSSQAVQNDLENTTWVLASFDDHLPIAGTQLTIQFGDRQLSGRAGCNQYGGDYHAGGGSIRFEGLHNTEMACMEPEGVMEQERDYLEALMSASSYELVDGGLAIVAGTDAVLTFEHQQDSIALPARTATPSTPAFSTSTATVEVVDPTSSPTPGPPDGYKEYRDSAAGILIYIPEGWHITGVIPGEYAIFQSYPEDKYVGGERREPGDTKCDLNIRPEGTSLDELIREWKSNPLSTIVSEEELILESGLIGRRFVIESMGTSVALVADVNHRVVVLTCFGDFTPVDSIAMTLQAGD